MTCTIIIFHYESLAYLRGVIRQIRKYRMDDIGQHIIIADQSHDEEYIKTIYAEYGTDNDISIIKTSPFGSGHSVDFVINRDIVKTDFICTIDVDTIPIHRNWLYAPIKMIQDKGLDWVGVHAQIESAYSYMGNFYCLCQHYRIGRTETYKDLSVNAGFCKSDHRKKIPHENHEWHGWSDDAVIAHWWEDKYRNNTKFTMGVSHYLGSAPTEGMYGRYTDDLVLHFGFSYNWKMVRNQQECMGNEYIEWMKRMETEGLSDGFINDILLKLKPLDAPIQREIWSGNKKTIHSPCKELNDYFNKLKAE